MYILAQNSLNGSCITGCFTGHCGYQVPDDGDKHDECRCRMTWQPDNRFAAAFPDYGWLAGSDCDPVNQDTPLLCDNRRHHIAIVFRTPPGDEYCIAFSNCPADGRAECFLFIRNN